MDNKYILSPQRKLTEQEKSLIWDKPKSHIESEYEHRICREVKRNWHRDELKITNILLEGDAGSGKTQLAKALSADFGLPYTKITCFADMDKSDVLGAILPVIDEDNKSNDIRYEYYPSEIVRAFEQGWLLEIQEPTVIRDAAVLMAINSALEPDGTINLPTRIVHRHPDFIAVITTNRGYNGCRPLNEALRDRMQHSEKMDLPPKEIMMERGAAKTGCEDESLLALLAECIIVLGKTAKANAIKGVAGMRSYFYWLDCVMNGALPFESMYQKVIYKITTDPAEIDILVEALTSTGLTSRLKEMAQNSHDHHESKNETVMEIHSSEDGKFEASDAPFDNNAIRLRKSADSEGHTDTSSAASAQTESSETGEDGTPIYHELVGTIPSEEQKKDFRKKLNQAARESVQGSVHEKTKLIVHRSEATKENRIEYHKAASSLMLVIRELVQKTMPLLYHETSSESLKSKLYGTAFHAEKLAAQDFRYFSRKSPPTENPTLAVALRIDESASMSAFGRLDAVKQTAIALYEFCSGSEIPIMIYGDTADCSRLEQMSIYAYVDFESNNPDDRYSLMNIQARSNNRDGMALRILSDRLLKATQETKLLISLSDGQPKALPSYSGDAAVSDMKNTLGEYRRKGISYLAAAIGHDKEIINEIYGAENTLDITDLRELPARLVQIIARYL